ncbi:MAG: spermidine synthase, partial [Gaiellaceae bacterium]
AYKPSTRDVLAIGLGGGSAPKRLWRDFPQLRIQAVEIDPVVRDVAYRYFGLPRDPRLAVTVDDGRSYLERNPGRRWDAILIDAFYADSIPFHLFTAEFLEQVREHLRPGGVVLVNTIGATAGAGSQLERAIYRTYRSAFATVLLHPVSLPGEGPTDVRNVMLVATDAPAPAREFLLRRWTELRREHPTAPNLAKPIRDRIDRPLNLDGVPILTDDYAPTDSLLLLE